MLAYQITKLWLGLISAWCPNMPVTPLSAIVRFQSTNKRQNGTCPNKFIINLPLSFTWKKSIIAVQFTMKLVHLSVILLFWDIRHCGENHYDDVMSKSCLKLPVIRLFPWQLLRTYINETTKQNYWTFQNYWNSPVTSEIPTQRARNVETVSIWWRYHVFNAGSLEIWLV